MEQDPRFQWEVWEDRWDNPGTFPGTTSRALGQTLAFADGNGLGKDEEWGKGNKRGSIKILRQITDKMQKEHGLKSTSPLLTHPPAPLQDGQSQGQNSAGGVSGLHVAQEDRRQQWATCVSLFKKYIHIELLLVLQWGGKHSGSVGKGRSLHSASFLPPLQKQRVGCVFYLLYLDLLIVDTHRSQGTGHLLLDILPPLLVLL